MTSKHDKARSLILAALMVFSVFAGTVAFSGAAAAANVQDADETVGDGAIVYQGQVVATSQSAFTADSTVNLREGTSDDPGTFIDTFTANGNGQVAVDTSRLETGQKYHFQEEGSATSFDFEVVEQTFTANVGSNNVSNVGTTTTTIEFESNRPTFDVVISADDLDNSDIQTLADDLSSTVEITDVDGDGEDEVVARNVDRNTEYELDFANVDTGSYDLTFDVEDTTANETVSFDVSDESSQDVSFTESTYETAQGDIAAVTVEFSGGQDDATLVVGNEDESGYEAVIDVTDGNDDGEVTVLFNTYAAGTNDDIVSAADASDGDSATLNTQNPSSLTDILEQGDYSLAVKGDTGHDADTVIDQPNDVGTLYINERSTESATVWNGPDVAERPELEELSEDSNIAAGEWVVVEFSATGLEGMIGDSDLDQATGVSFSVDQTEDSTKQNANPNDITIADHWADSENGTYYIAFDTNDADIEAGQVYNATLTVEDERLLGSSDDKEVVGSTFEIEEKSISLDEDPVNVTASENQNITGTSNLAPGTEFQVQIESTGDTQPRFFESAEATVQQDGSWSVTFDRFAQQSVGDTFDVTIKALSDPVTADGNVVEQTETPTTTDNTTTSATPTETPTDGTPTDTPTEGGTPTPTEEQTETDTPGFGVAVALVALLAAALLAVRRD